LEEFHKPLIAIGLSFYEDADCLGHCLSSVLEGDAKLSEYVAVLALDGPYLGYPTNNELSMDGSREVIQSFQEQHGKDKVQLYDVPNLHERFKRQRYIDIAASQGIPFVLILDSDEYIQCKKPITFLEELIEIERQWKETNFIHPELNPKVGNVTSVKCIDVDGQGFPTNVGLRPRLWYRPEDMHYTTKHFWFKRKDQLIKTGSFDDGSQYKSLSVENLVIWHDHSCRTQDREDRRHYYEVEALPKLEGPSSSS
jgi:hypothetical protein